MLSGGHVAFAAAVLSCAPALSAQESAYSAATAGHRPSAATPSAGSPLFFPWQLGVESQRLVYQYTLGYLLVAALLFAWGWLLQSQGVRPIENDETLLPGDHTDAA